MKFRIKGEDRPVAISSYEGLLHYLNGTSQSPSNTIDDFMVDYAERAFKFRSLEITTSNVESFVEDLINNGEIERLD